MIRYGRFRSSDDEGIGMELGPLTTPYQLFLGAAIINVVIGGASLLLACFTLRASVRNGVLQALAERDKRNR